jgi:hypothetical protein
MYSLNTNHTKFIYDHIKHIHIIQFHTFIVHTITQHTSTLTILTANMVGTSSCDTMLSHKNFIMFQCLNFQKHKV